MDLIKKPSDLILIRYALGYNQEQMGRLIGVAKDGVQLWEGSKNGLDKRTCLAYRYITLTIPESEQIESLLHDIDSEDYVDFLRSLRSTGVLPRTSVYQCKCKKPTLTYSLKQLKTYTRLVVHCSYCKHDQSLKNMGDYRRYMLKQGTLDLFNPNIYDFESWRGAHGTF